MAADKSTDSGPGIQMLQGVVAMIDALGFKGIWGRDPQNPSTDVLDTLKRIGEAAEATRSEAKLYLKRGALPEEVVRLNKDPDVKVVQLSDTIVVAAGRRLRARSLWARHAAELERAGYDPVRLDKAVDGYMRYLVCKCVSQILRTAALCAPPLTYRGVVTCGMFAIDRNFLLGPAVDEAASLLDLAEGPFVWLAPSARGLRRDISEVEGLPWRTIAYPYDVPLKGGQVLGTRVVNPFAFCTGKEERREVSRNFLKAMASTKIDVVVKRDNARKLYQKLLGHHARVDEESQQRLRKAFAGLGSALLGGPTGATAVPSLSANVARTAAAAPTMVPLARGIEPPSPAEGDEPGPPRGRSPSDVDE
jgi:hypothetical protein